MDFILVKAIQYFIKKNSLLLQCAEVGGKEFLGYLAPCEEPSSGAGTGTHRSPESLLGARSNFLAACHYHL